MNGHGAGLSPNLFDGVFEVAFSPDSTRLATAGADGTARIWELETGLEVLTLSGHEGRVRNVDFSPDGRLLATSSESPDGSVRIWDADSGQQLILLPPSHRDGVWGLAFSPDGTLLATAGQDATTKIWQLDTASSSGHLLATLSGHNGTVRQIAFNAAGDLLATSGGDEVKLWDLSGVYLAAQENKLAEIVVPEWISLPGGFGLAISPDGETLVAATGDNSFRSYLLDLEDLLALAGNRLTRNFSTEECNQYRIDPCPGQ